MVLPLDLQKNSLHREFYFKQFRRPTFFFFLSMAQQTLVTLVPCPPRDSNPQSQEASGRKPTPQTARPLRSTEDRCGWCKTQSRQGMGLNIVHGSCCLLEARSLRANSRNAACEIPLYPRKNSLTTRQWASKLFSKKGHALYCGLVSGQHVNKKIINLPKYLCNFYSTVP